LEHAAALDKADRADPDARITSDLGIAAVIVHRACDQQDRTTESSGEAKTAAGSRPTKARLGTELRKVPIHQTGALPDYDGRAEFGRLGVLSGIILFLIGMLFALGLAHYAIIFARLVSRDRRNCMIPAVLIFDGEKAYGRIIILGQFGCTFDCPLPEGLAKAGIGTSCEIAVGSSIISAKLLKMKTKSTDLLFRDAPARAERSRLLSTSIVPTHYDLSALRHAHFTGGRFGYGTLPKIARAAR
jgi:hypothetical protein